jgi:uncharacterized membrane protein
MADEQRIAVLEQHVRSLYEQIAALRAELGAREHPSPTASAAPAAPPPAAPPRAAPVFAAPEPPRREPPRPPLPPPRVAYPSPPAIDLEGLLGRYGTIALASLAILMGVGTFLSWAIQHGLLGPVFRVVLGFIGAAVVAGVGVWVREHRDVRFGNVLLALALAIVHVDAWAAGPHLHVLSTVAALAIAALASAALAALALTSDVRTLFAIGFGGALLAPFVTSSEPGSVIALLTYGWVVIATTIFAIRERGWRPILWLTVVGAAVYVTAGVAGLAGRGVGASWLTARAPPLFAFACAGAAILWARDTLRSKLALAFLLLACGAAAAYALGASTIEVAISLFGTIAAYLIARELATDEFWLAIGNVVIPLGFLAATIISAHSDRTRAIAAIALTVLSAVLAWDADEERGLHLFVAAVSSGIAILFYVTDDAYRSIPALALHGALFSVVFRSTRERLLAIPIVIGLGIASVWTLILLDLRPEYHYAPFGGVLSLCALAVVCAWAVFAFAVRPTAEEKSPDDRALAIIVGGLAITAAFVWIRQELAFAWSPDAASFALIVYYALAGLALIFAGRWRRVGLWRGVGLALAFYAGYKALAETFAIDAIALRVGARILVGVFLAAVAYWYRAPHDPAAAAPAPDTSLAGASTVSTPL